MAHPRSENPDQGAHLRLRSRVYATLSNAFLDEPTPADVDAVADISAFLHRLAVAANRPSLSEAARQMQEQVRSASASEPALDALARDFARVFLIGAGAVSPCESVFRSEEGLAMQEQRDETLAFFARCGLAPRSDCAEPADHIGVQLAFMASLNDSACLLDVCDALLAQQAFIKHRLAPWLPALRARLNQVDPGGWYACLGALVAEAVSADVACWLPALTEAQSRPPLVERPGR